MTDMGLEKYTIDFKNEPTKGSWGVKITEGDMWVTGSNTLQYKCVSVVRVTSLYVFYVDRTYVERLFTARMRRNVFRHLFVKYDKIKRNNNG